MTGALTFTSVPTISSLVGTTGSDSLIRSINVELNNSDFFGGINDYLSAARTAFVNNIVQPIRVVGNTIRNLVGMLDYEDRYIAITTPDLMRNIPVCMHDPILAYEPIRKLFDENRIFGFGREYIPQEDPYSRLISNGTVNDVLAAMNPKGEFSVKHEFWSTDPELSFEELESIEETRNYIDHILATTNYDPTDYDNLRG